MFTEAVDPEDDLVRYDIVGGNEFQHFLIEESTGEIRVNTSLDREQIENYILTVRASDNGGKSTNATVNIQILDVNDQTPKFVDVEPFRVVEGQSGALVGKVEAKDNDIGENAIVFYSIGNKLLMKIVKGTQMKTISSPKSKNFQRETFSGLVPTQSLRTQDSENVFWVTGPPFQSYCGSK